MYGQFHAYPILRILKKSILDGEDAILDNTLTDDKLITIFKVLIHTTMKGAKFLPSYTSTVLVVGLMHRRTDFTGIPFWKMAPRTRIELVFLSWEHSELCRYSNGALKLVGISRVHTYL